MALSPIAYRLKPNQYDGKQRMSDPEGVLEPSVNLGAAQNMRATSATTGSVAWAYDYTGTNHTGFELQMDRSTGTGFVSEAAYLEATARTYTGVTTAETYTGGRVRPIRESVTQPPSSGTIFWDTFEGQPINSVPGVNMNKPTGAANAEWSGTYQRTTETCYVTGDKGYSSNKSLRFNFNPEVGTQCAALFKLGGVNHDLEFTLMLYIPDGNEPYGGASYTHPDDASGNERLLFRIYNTTSNNPHMIAAQLRRINATDSSLQLAFGDTSGGLTEEGPAIEWISSVDQGTWIETKFIIACCRAGQPQTRIQVERNSVPQIDYVKNNYQSLWPTGYDRGNILGIWQSGFDAATTMLVDDPLWVSTGDWVDPGPVLPA